MPPLKITTKKLCSLLKHFKQDSSGTVSLRTPYDDCEKSYALKRQFQSVFSPKSLERFSCLACLAKQNLQGLNDQRYNLSFE